MASAFGRLKNNADFLRYLHAANLRKRKQLIKNASREELKSLCECAFNLVKKSVKPTPAQLRQLSQPKVKKLVYHLADRRFPLAKKRKLLIQAGGGFPFALLAPIVTTILGGLISSSSD
jgi:hypothetical protein